MTTLQLKGKNGGKAFISDEDAELVSGYEWRQRKDPNRVVAYDSKEIIYLHRLIMRPDQGMQVDHIDGNQLNNTRQNLRICTHAENMLNLGIYKNNTSGYKGVWKKRNKWVAEIHKQGKRHIIGYFTSKIDAALAYNQAAIELHGSYARLNKIGEL